MVLKPPRFCGVGVTLEKSDIKMILLKTRSRVLLVIATINDAINSGQTGPRIPWGLRDVHEIIKKSRVPVKRGMSTGR